MIYFFLAGVGAFHHESEGRVIFLRTDTNGNVFRSGDLYSIWVQSRDIHRLFLIHSYFVFVHEP